jgi:ribonuclease HII
MDGMGRLGRLIAGVDEAGRGPLAGPVVAAAVILDPTRPIAGLADSKKLSAAKREALYQLIMTQALAVGVGRSEAVEIDQINILQATLVAMRRAVLALSVVPELLLIDGNRCPAIDIPARAIIGGDDLEPCISAASIIAKVTRDREMAEYEAQYPGYGFAQHKGYGTKVHMAALQILGASAQHRKSFAPVRMVMTELEQVG